MDLKYVKNLLAKIEILAIDTQPIRDFLIKTQNRELDINKYSSIFETIQLVMDTGNFKPGHVPIQLQTLLEHLKNKMEDAVFNYSENTKQQVSKTSTEKDLLILSTLVDIKKDLDTLKSKDNRVVVQEIKKVEDSKVEIDQVFIKPILDIDSITGKVSVEEKIESNMTEKLNRLKKFKRGIS